MYKLKRNTRCPVEIIASLLALAESWCKFSITYDFWSSGVKPYILYYKICIWDMGEMVKFEFESIEL